MANGKMTIGELGRKVDDLSVLLKEHILEDRKVFKDIQDSLSGNDEYPGVRGRLRDLEAVTKPIPGLVKMKTRLYTITGVFGSIVTFLGWDYLRSLFIVEVIKP